MAKFCPECGFETERKYVAGRKRDACPNCDFVEFTKAKIGVGAIIFREGSVLLVERVLPPRGIWTIPSGYQEEGETLEMAVKREVLEETGINVQPQGIVFLRNMMEHGAIDMYSVFHCEQADGEHFVNNAESISVRYVSFAEFDNLNIEADSRWFIETYQSLRFDSMTSIANSFTHPYLQIFAVQK